MSERLPDRAVVTALNARALPRMALTRPEAAAALGISLDSFERYVQSDLRLVRRGRLRLIPVGRLERWLERNASAVLE